MKILIFKLAGIGDVVLSTPVAAELRREFPRAEIVWLVGQAAAPAIQNHPAINRVIVVDETVFWEKKLFGILQLFLQLRREHFSAVYILHWSPMFHLFFRLLGVPYRSGFARQGKSFGLTYALPYFEGDSDAHDVDQYLSLTGTTSADAAVDRRPRIFITNEERAIASRWRASGGEPHIALAPGGGNNSKLFMPQKRWPFEHFGTLTQRLLDEYPNATISVLGDHSESALLLGCAVEDRRVRILAGKLSLRDSAALIQQCELFIGNDSGLFHIAGAVETPLLVFFGPTSPNGKGPSWTVHQILYRSEPCSPCYKYGVAPPCPYGLKCLTQISPEQAFNAANALLRKRPHFSLWRRA